MIEVRQISKRYGDVTAVDRLTFDVRPGVVTGFLGPNGAGKTTTMRMILGLDAPTAGDALVLGVRYADLPAPMRAVGALLDAGAAHPRRTARDHLVCLADSNGIGRRRVDEVLGLTGLSAVAGRGAGTFSLGMRQRLGIAAALLGDPAVLVLDEPVNGLDPEGILWIRTLMRDLAAEGRTVLVSSHLMSEMAVTADHLVMIGRGRLIADISVEDVLRSREVLVRTPEARRFAGALTAMGAAVRQDGEELTVAGVSAEEVGRLAAAEGVVLHELTPRRTSLEDAFMALTRDGVEFGAAR
ncbi:ATP-binding cassette domain-containing protein [Sphaerisporangium rubeum]|uniref:ABC-2 type transport system ATP-binding protein n=1 Tax=Sphaerisporangium rubeum TaxID=321317 RepID=A0A7X0IGX7_9ACTN|nr:ABC-2 type transport system ATP-binding protein [Sphaerisporangium rubeum]